MALHILYPHVLPSPVIYGSVSQRNTGECLSNSLCVCVSACVYVCVCWIHVTLWVPVHGCKHVEARGGRRISFSILLCLTPLKQGPSPNQKLLSLAKLELAIRLHFLCQPELTLQAQAARPGSVWALGVQTHARTRVLSLPSRLSTPSTGQSTSERLGSTAGRRTQSLCLPDIPGGVSATGCPIGGRRMANTASP